MPSTPQPGLKSLIEEARRRSDDTRRDMLRLLAKLYLAEPSHGADEQERFATLASRLIEAVDVAEAAPVVRSLAPRPDLPRALVMRLVEAPIALAGPVLRLSPVLDDDALLDIAGRASPAHLAAITARREIAPDLAKRLAAAVDRSGEHIGADAAALPAPPEPAEVPAEVPAEPLAGLPAPLPLPDFLAAGPEERTLIIARLVTLAPLPLAERITAPGEAFTDSVLDAAKNGDRAALAALLERGLGITAENAARVAADSSGQALAVAARALGLSFAILSRVLFRIHPVVGRSAADMTRLADMFDSLSNAGAQHLVASLRAGARRLPPRPDEDSPSMRDYAIPRSSAHPHATEHPELRHQLQ